MGIAKIVSVLSESFALYWSFYLWSFWNDKTSIIRQETKFYKLLWISLTQTYTLCVELDRILNYQSPFSVVIYMYIFTITQVHAFSTLNMSTFEFARCKAVSNVMEKASRLTSQNRSVDILKVFNSSCHIRFYTSKKHIFFS